MNFTVTIKQLTAEDEGRYLYNITLAFENSFGRTLTCVHMVLHHSSPIIEQENIV